MDVHGGCKQTSLGSMSSRRLLGPRGHSAQDSRVGANVQQHAANLRATCSDWKPFPGESQDPNDKWELDMCHIKYTHAFICLSI